VIRWRIPPHEKSPRPEQILLEYADKAFVEAFTFWISNKNRGTAHITASDFFLTTPESQF
jgi:hypothetical protein